MMIRDKKAQESIAIKIVILILSAISFLIILAFGLRLVDVFGADADPGLIYVQSLSGELIDLYDALYNRYAPDSKTFTIVIPLSLPAQYEIRAQKGVFSQNRNTLCLYEHEDKIDLSDAPRQIDCYALYSDMDVAFVPPAGVNVGDNGIRNKYPQLFPYVVDMEFSRHVVLVTVTAAYELSESEQNNPQRQALEDAVDLSANGMSLSIIAQQGMTRIPAQLKSAVEQELRSLQLQPDQCVIMRSQRGITFYQEDLNGNVGCTQLTDSQVHRVEGDSATILFIIGEKDV